MNLSPSLFWSLSLSEWRWLAGEDAAAPGRVDLDALIASYPDEPVPSPLPRSGEGRRKSRGDAR
jgi:hypothetical protein